MIDRSNSWKRRIIIGMLSLCLVPLGACNHRKDTPRTLPVQTLYSSADCAIESGLLQQMARAELEALLDTRPKQFGEKPVSLDVDEGENMLVLFALGRQPSAGHGIELTGDTATLQDGILMLPARVIRPAPDSMQAQVLTSPCSVFALPRVEFSEIRLDSE